MELRKVKAPASGVSLDTGAGTRVYIAPGAERAIPINMLNAAVNQGAIVLDKSDEVTQPDSGIALEEALLRLIREGDPDNFTKDGQPKAHVVRRLVGARVPVEEIIGKWDEITAREAD